MKTFLYSVFRSLFLIFTRRDAQGDYIGLGVVIDKNFCIPFGKKVAHVGKSTLKTFVELSLICYVRNWQVIFN